ncbi:MAG: hypothetical protein QM541_15775 [Flavobacterium sp.]|nr:hypothetical protein [Flavobacterium sp.]
MKRLEPITFEVVAQSGSKLEKVVLQLIQDMDANRNRLKDDFIKRKENNSKNLNAGYNFLKMKMTLNFIPLMVQRMRFRSLKQATTLPKMTQ